MIRINERAVHLTDSEMAISYQFDDMLDEGLSIAEAVTKLRSIHAGRGLSDEFWTWLNH